MSADLPNWLKLSSEAVKIKQQKERETREAEMANRLREIPYDEALSSMRAYWEDMNVDNILSDLNTLFGKDLQDLWWDPHSYTGSCPNSTFIRLSRKISEEHSYDDTSWGGTIHTTITIFSIELHNKGFKISYYDHAKELGFPKDEDRLKDKIDKFLSSKIKPLL